jgi:hypothetical protein
MAKSQTSSIRIDPDVWREAKLLAVSRGITIGGLIEELLRNEIKKAKKKGWKVNEERRIL